MRCAVACHAELGGKRDTVAKASGVYATGDGYTPVELGSEGTVFP